MEGIEIGDIYSWWWSLDAVKRADICTSLKGSLGDAVLTDPPEYLCDHILWENPQLIYEV